MQRSVVAVDLDDVVAGFNAAYLIHHNVHYGTTLTFNDLTTYNMAAHYGGDEATVKQRVFHFCHHHHDDVQLVDGAYEAVHHLRRRHRLDLVTARCESLRDITTAWMKSQNVHHFTKLHFTNGFSTLTHRQRCKADVCRQIGAQVLIEDSPHNALVVSQAGIPVLLMDKPWNQGIADPGIIRVHSWDEAVTWIEDNVAQAA